MEEESRRKNDIQLVALVIRFEDFIERYDRDTRSTQSQMAKLIQIVETHDEFIRDIKPIYNKGMIALGAAALGFIGLGVNWIWNHIKWG